MAWSIMRESDRLVGKAQEWDCERKKIVNKKNEKGYRNKPLTDEQKASNK
jgi:hypothetical protein